MALVRKILETTISSGGTTATFTDSDIPNSLIRVYSTDSNIYPQTVSLTGNTLTVTYEAVSSSLGVAVEIVKQGLTINDTLTSTATDEALSANQGKALKDLIDNLGVPSLTELSDVEITSLADGDIIQYDSDTSKFINTPLTISTNLTDLDDVDVTSIQDGQVLAWDSNTSKFVNVNQSGGINYSTTEQIIGTWIDGKTLYGRVIVINSPASSLNYHENEFDNIDSFLLQGGYYDQAGAQIALNSYESGTYYTRTGFRNSYKDIYIRTSNYSFNKAYLIIAYTKIS